MRSKTSVWWTGFALSVAGCVEPLPPYDSRVLSGPDELLRRIMAVADSGKARDPAISERLLGLQWRMDGSTPGPSQWLMASVTEGPAWLSQTGRRAASLRARPRDSPSSSGYLSGWRVLLDFRLAPEAVCIPMDQVLREFGQRGEWRRSELSSGYGTLHFFAVRSGPGNEVWFHPTNTHPFLDRGPPGCVIKVGIAQECDARCS